MHPPPEVRFWSKIEIDKATDCWIWTGGKKAAGYGQFWVDRRKVIVHRWAYTYFVGDIPPGFEVDHLCKKRSCSNPAHLEAVTLKENRRRRDLGRTHCNHGHLLSEDNLLIHVDKRGHESRMCRACAQIRSDRKKAKLRAQPDQRL